MAASDAAFEKGLPANLEAERLVLGSILLDDTVFLEAGSSLNADDFSIEKHRRIFSRMQDLHQRGDRIDRVTLANELVRQNQLESVDGLAYLVSLDDGLPRLPDIGAYIRIVKDKSQLRRLIFVAEKIRDRAFIGQDTADEIAAGAEEALLQLGESNQRDALVRPGEIIETFPGGLNAFLDPTRRKQGISTGFVKLDEMTGGLRGGELFILAARPAMGKTALALNIAQHVACNPKDPRTVAVFSLEMSKESLLTRLVCSVGRVNQQKFRSGFMAADERRQLQGALGQIMDAPLFLDDTAAANLMDIHSKLRKLKQQYGLGLVVIDYLQLMSSRGRVENRNQEVSAISRGLKLLSKELDVPIIALSQLSRATEARQGDHRPQLSDLRESGSIEQDADMVAFVFREEYYKRDREDLRGQAELILAKQRNGPTGSVPLLFIHQYTKFENPAAVYDETPPEDMP
ncbi:replicative DNA helicase [Bryobacterales bacterium F-183]|nr:replicative DNA helicase [Bryobacterales bacterium F-183]